MKKAIICAAMAAASAVFVAAARGDARPLVTHESRPVFKGEFMCGVNFGFYAREGYYESQFKDDPKGDKGFAIRGKPAQEVMRRHYKGRQ